MKRYFLSYYKRLSLVQKLSIPLLFSFLFGFLLTAIIVKEVRLIDYNIGLLKDTYIPALERATNNKALLKKISETLTFATLSAEEDMVLEIDDHIKIENNLKKIMVDKNLNLKHVDKYLKAFKEYFDISTKYALNSIKNSSIDDINEDNTELLLKKYNEVKNFFLQLSVELKSKISIKTNFIESISLKVIYFTILYITIFSVILFYVSYLIYKDFNDRFNNLSKSVNKLGISQSLSKDNDSIEKLAKNIDRAIEDYNIIENQKKELTRINKNIKDSIEYASLIQQAILPSKDVLDKYTNGNFIFWKPKDIVGGDIYFIVELANREEILVMVIDGAGHGVPGAFLTILVKAVQNQIVAGINRGILSPSPAIILEEFNKSIKTMLNQKKGSKSNAGFDGGVLYYNRLTNNCRYAGAKTPLYIVNADKLEIIKSDRANVGFIRTQIDQKYTEYSIEIKKGTKLYITTDGIIDQEGKDGTRYGKKRFQDMIKKVSDKNFEYQKSAIVKSFFEFKENYEQSDDITIVGLEFKL